MSDIKTQLRTYFDETVERVTEEDVRIRATTDWGVPIPSPRFRPRALAAGAIGFGLATTLLGVVLVADRVFGVGMSEVGGNGGRGVVTTSEPGSAWLFIPVVFGLGLLATGIISARRRNGDMRERGGGIMQTIEKVEPMEAPVDNEILNLKKRNRWLGWLAGILAVAVVAMGAWMIFADSGGQSLTAEQEQMLVTIDTYSEAWNSGDGEAAVAVMMPSAYHQVEGRKYTVANGELADYVEFVHSGGVSFRVSDTAVHGTVVVTTVHIPADSATERTSIYEMSPDGSKILWHWYLGS